LKKLKEIASKQTVNGRPLIEDPRFRDRIAQVELELMALEITNLRVLSAVATESRAPGPEVSLLKIKGSEIIQQLAELQMHALGPRRAALLREALEMDWVADRHARRALRRLCAAADRPVLQPAQDHDLRRLDRDPEKHHLKADPGSLRGVAMDFRYSDEQLALQDTLQALHRRDYDFERRRALARSDLGFSADAWAQYAALGLLALPFPEQFGGLGGNGVDVMVVMEQFGQGLLLEPYLSTVVSAAD
jgi:alkylation response protein AidB-like acyl-CoA dehydrogenase